MLLEVSGNLVATAADVETSAVQQFAAGRGELVGLALWVMQERSLVRMLPAAHSLSAAEDLPTRTEQIETGLCPFMGTSCAWYQDATASLAHHWEDHSHQIPGSCLNLLGPGRLVPAVNTLPVS